MSNRYHRDDRASSFEEASCDVRCLFAALSNTGTDLPRSLQDTIASTQLASSDQYTTPISPRGSQSDAKQSHDRHRHHISSSQPDLTPHLEKRRAFVRFVLPRPGSNARDTSRLSLPPNGGSRLSIIHCVPLSRFAFGKRLVSPRVMTVFNSRVQRLIWPSGW